MLIHRSWWRCGRTVATKETVCGQPWLSTGVYVISRPSCSSTAVDERSLLGSSASKTTTSTSHELTDVAPARRSCIPATSTSTSGAGCGCYTPEKVWTSRRCRRPWRRRRPSNLSERTWSRRENPWRLYRMRTKRRHCRRRSSLRNEDEINVFDSSVNVSGNSYNWKLPKRLHLTTCNLQFLFNQPIFQMLSGFGRVPESEVLGIVVQDLLRGGGPSCRSTNSVNSLNGGKVFQICYFVQHVFSQKLNC